MYIYISGMWQKKKKQQKEYKMHVRNPGTQVIYAHKTFRFFLTIHTSSKSDYCTIYKTACNNRKPLSPSTVALK